MCSADASWLATLLDQSDVALVGIDLDGKVVFWNRGAEKLFGWTADEVRARTPPMVPPALRQEWQLQMQRTIQTGQPTPAAETQRITRDGRSITVVRTASPARNALGEITGLLDVLVDATALKQLDEQSRALIQVRERDLLAMDLHDGLIQSLYGLVLNLAAQEQRLGQREPAAVQVIREVRAEVERVIGETRAYVAELRGRSVTPRSLETGLRLLLDSLRLNAGLDFELHVDAALEPLLSGEVRGHLLFVAREALSNVARHAQARRVRIDLTRIDGKARLRIQDDGRGFDGSRTDRHRGLHNLVERARLMGGGLEIDSSPGRGTTVSLEVPLADTR